MIRIVFIIFISCVNLLTAKAQILPSPSSLIVSTGVWLYQNTNKSQYRVDLEANASTFEEAKLEGFRQALNQAVGSLTLSSIELKNGFINNHEIINYASGYIDRYEILNQTEKQGITTLRMRVWVSHSQISDRLLHKSEKSGEVEGPRASVQLGSIIRERHSGDSAISHILRDFPQRSFDIEIGKTNFNYDDNRSAKLELTFKIKWNHEYLMALSEVLEQISLGKAEVNCRYLISPPVNGINCPYKSYIQIKTKIPNKFFFSKKNINYGFDDDEKIKLFTLNILQSKPAILLTVKNTNGEIHSQNCYRWISQQSDGNAIIAEGLGIFWPPPSSKFYIDGWSELILQAPINFNNSPSVLNSLGKVEIDVVRNEKCPR